MSTDALTALRARRHSLCCLVCGRKTSDGVTLFRKDEDKPWLCEVHAPKPA